MSKIPSKTALVGTMAQNVRYCQDHGIDLRDDEYIFAAAWTAVRGHSCFINVVTTGPMDTHLQESILDTIEANNARYR